MRKTFIYVLWALLLLSMAGVAAVFTAIAKGKIGYVPPVEELENPNLKFATQIISDDGQLLGTWSLSKENRVYVGYEDLSPHLVHALVATEDVRFSEHSGIDARAFMRAVVKRGILMQKHAGGGSTITQQLVKNMYYDQNKTFARKAAEAWTALYVERQLSKEEILELYINTIYFGDGYYGLKEASLGYFGKEPQELTDSEAILLAGIPNAPSAYAPSRHADLALQREKQVLAAMVKYGYLEQSETDSLLWDAAADPVLAR